ncbi:hypothetical protein [Epilithonimonas tenax]|uniref:hypothetical protein n=1 Tax=Epilithonimonas tenax TaxID=191577 RepID=UPI000484C776|nr:hypothetical protein [Epilithonimonas tenax]
MKINNQKEIATAMYGYFLLILLDILCLLFLNKFIPISKTTLYGCFFGILIFSIWRLVKLRRFSLEVTEHIFSVKYTHPLMKSRQPILEVPIQKIISLRSEKEIINYILIVSINTKRGIRNFHYDIGQLPENQFDKFKSISEFVKTVHFNEKDELNTVY